MSAALSANDREGEIGLALEDLGDALGRLALPIRPAIIAQAASLPVVRLPMYPKIESVHVDELQGEVSRFLNRRIAADKRLGAKVIATKE
jgi:hypothetical protein